LPSDRGKVRLPLGRFTVRIETIGVSVGETPITMSSLDKDQPPIVATAK
jgi:hypothetical protein